MALKDEYFRYLEHFGEVLTVGRFAQEPKRQNAIALRHDVDHELDLALEMAWWEQRRGVASTYYLLDTADYWGAPDFVQKCLQLSDFGHELGLHVNTVAKWMSGTIDNVQQDLGQALSLLRQAGIEVKTISAHGDPLCYQMQFINYWAFSELRPADAAVSESGLSAEGVATDDDRFRVDYPPDHQLQRTDGAAFRLWSVPMSALGLEHEAMHVPFDSYFSDSGGTWLRSPDPLTTDLRRGRHQVLIHPEHWRGPQQIYIFLSAPRSGSRWLSSMLGQATPLRSRHEFILNHRYEQGELKAEKRTLEHINELVADPASARELMVEARTWIQDLDRDYAEVNVYLHHFPDLLRQIFPDAMLVHLHRDPKEVVRSLMNRDWYDTPEDNRHPVLAVEGWEHLGQFEKVCHFVRMVNDRLLSMCADRMAFAAMTGDAASLSAALSALELPFFPRLAGDLVGRPLNISARAGFPAPADWEPAQWRIFSAICGPSARKLGYADHPADGGKSAPESAIAVVAGRKARAGGSSTLLNIDFDSRVWAHAVQPVQAVIALFQACVRELRRRRGSNMAVVKQTALLPGSTSMVSMAVKGCKVAFRADALSIASTGETENSYVVFGGGTWFRLESGQGWPARIGHWYRGQVDLALEAEAHISLFCLMYDAGGRMFEKRHLANFDPSVSQRRFSFRTRPAADRFTLALLCRAGVPGCKLLRMRLEQVSPERGTPA